MSAWTLHLAFSPSGLHQAQAIAGAADRIVQLWADAEFRPSDPRVVTLARRVSSDHTPEAPQRGNVVDDAMLANWCIDACSVVSWR